MSIRVLKSINSVSAEAWDALFPDYPFTRHAFLATLENTACTTSETGWQVNHLVFEKNNQIVAALPVYKKFDSWGEYVFDWAWADAYQRTGLNYYPKLLCAMPFTPATGPRIGFLSQLSDEEQTEITHSFINFGTSNVEASGFHLLFPNIQNAKKIQTSKLKQRFGYQFHWFNQGFDHFDQFLESFTSRKRKNIKRERAKALETGLQIIVEEGEHISAERWHTFFIFYHTTYLKRSGRYGYLSEDFFKTLAQTMPEDIVLVSALDKNKAVAMALFFKDKETLYGRYWGCSHEIDCLHFELCYYQGIDYAIKHQLKRFDPGAQGEHKIQRGFTPVYTSSWHHLNDQRFSHAIDGFLQAEKNQLEAYLSQARQALPFKQDVEIVRDNILIS